MSPFCESARILKVRTVELAESGVGGGTPGFDPQKLAAARDLRLRVDNGKVFLKTEEAAEFEVTLAPAPAPSICLVRALCNQALGALTALFVIVGMNAS